MIPDDIRRFIVQCIPTVPYLEALLLLRESRPQEWSGEQLAQRLYLNTPTADALLTQLTHAGLLCQCDAEAPRYVYSPRTPQLGALVDQLAAVYGQNLVEVSTLIHLKTNRKAHLFADAFVWRKKEH